MAADKNFDAPDRTAFEKATIEACTDHGRYYFQKGQRKQFNNRHFTIKISNGRPSTLLIGRGLMV